MSDKTGIEWTDATWNVLRGCSRVSEGCRNCYAETVAARFSGAGQPYEGLAKWVTRPGGKREARWTGKTAFVPKVLDQPLRWTRPRRIFVNSMSDVFHESVPDEWIDQIFAVMALAPQHSFQVLTKRPERMRDWFAERWQGTPATKIAGINIPAGKETGRHEQVEMACEPLLQQFRLADPDRDNLWTADGKCKAMQWRWPLPNVWLGVSVEDQATADARIPLLLETPAAVRWVSAEPLLGALDLRKFMWPVCHSWPAGYRSLAEARAAGAEIKSHRQALVAASRRFLNWVVVGGESGPDARAMHPDWVRQIRDDCERAGVAFLFKQWGEWISHEDALDVLGQDNPRVGDGRARLRNPGEGLTVLNDTTMIKVGKKAAGRMLDGRLHDGYPRIAA